MTQSSVVAVVIAGFLALALPVLLVPWLRRAEVVDTPNARSSHSRPALRGGGIAQTAGWGVGLSIAATHARADDRSLLWILAFAGLAAASIGLAEDLSGVSVSLRAAGAFMVGLLVGLIASQVLGVHSWWAVVGAVACLGGVNVVNFMDGVNGISALHGMVAGGTFAVVGLIHDAPWLVVSGAILATTFAAFLPWNLSGKLFLGDVGSYLLGGVVAMMILLGWMQGLPLVPLAAPMSIYIADTGVTLLSRIAGGEPWREAHRDHLYQRLYRNGMTHVQVSLAIAALSGTCAVLGVAASTQPGFLQAASLTTLIVIVGAYAVLRHWIDPDSSEQARAS